MTDIIGNQKIVKRIAELKTLGLSNQNIAELIGKEFNVETPDVNLIKGIIKSYSVKGTEFLEKDKEISLMYKKLLHDLVDDCYDNRNIMQEAKRILFSKMKIYEENSALEQDPVEARKASKELINYIERIQNAIRTTNDTIKTAKGMLDVLSQHKKEISSSVVGIQSISQHLSELEKEGYIQINPEYKELAKYSIEVKGGNNDGRTKGKEEKVSESPDVGDRQEKSEQGTEGVEISTEQPQD